MPDALPEGYTARPAGMVDARPVAELFSARSLWLNGVEEPVEARAEEIAGEWGFEFFHPESDSLAVFTMDGAPAAYADFFDVRAPHVSLIGTSVVHPDAMGRGIGSFLAAWLEERGRANLPKAPEGARVALQQGVQSNNTAAVDLLARRGYRHTHSSYRMRIDFERPPEEPALPQGISIRPIHGEEEKRQALLARYESFLDHRGAVEEPFEEYYRRWQDILAKDPFHDPSLWFVAWEGGEPAGLTVSYASTEDDPGMGWVQSLGVRRAWRKRGLGLALLQHTFCRLYERGLLRAGLGVDASSLTGATRLYERAGMRVERTYLTYELELRPGKDLTKQHAD